MVNRLLQILMTIVLVGISLVGPVSAAPASSVAGDGVVGGSCDESAFDTAVAMGGSITFNCGGPKTIQLTSPAGINLDTTIDGGGVITLTGNLATQLFSVGVGIKLTLKNIILDKGFANHNAGGAIVNAGNLTLDNVVIQNSVAGQQGGAIWTSGPVTIRNSSLKGNSAKSGGGITLQNPTPLTIDNSTFTGNSAQDGTNGVGGAIQLGAGAQLTMTGGSLGSNLAAVEGGALDLAAGARATFLPGGAGGTSISNNRAQYFGGAISNNGGLLNLQGADVEYNSTLTNTVSVGFGGAIDEEGAMVLVDSRIANNQGRFGGGVFVGGNAFSATASITRTVFFANFAAQNGGGLYTNTNGTITSIEDDSFEFNQAGFAGGGLSRVNAKLNISRSSFTSNTAVNGGGLGLAALPHPADGPYVEIHDTTISGNLATSQFGGGINNSGLLDLVNVTLAGNHTSLGAASDTKTPINYTGLLDVITDTVTRLQDTVLDNPGGFNCAGTSGAGLPSSAGFNYSTDTSCGLTGFHDTEGDGLNAMLGSLTQAGSFTEYKLPQPGSPLIDQGGPGCSPKDQRYALRNGACDIGAVEFDGLLPKIYVPLFLR